MEQICISRNDEYHEAWPSISKTHDGRLIVAYKESDGHLNLEYSRIVTRTSSDKGRTWSDRSVIYSSEDPERDGLVSAGRLLILEDGTLMLFVDRFFIDKTLIGQPYLLKYMNGEALIYRSTDNGSSWDAPSIVPIKGLISSVRQIKNGSILVGCTHFSYKENLYQNKQIQIVYISKDLGETWGEPITVLDHPEFQQSEGDFVEFDDGVIICYMRDEDFRGDLPNRTTGLKCFSYDGGYTWEGPYSSGRWLYNGSMAAGLLENGMVMVTSRLGMGRPEPYFGYFPEEPRRKPELIGYWCGQHSPYFYAYVESQEDAMMKSTPGADYDMPLPSSAKWFVIDRDLNKAPDYGYSSWTNTDDGNVLIVQFITDDAPPGRPQIRGYKCSLDEIMNPERDVSIDFSSKEFTAAPLAGQEGWFHIDGDEKQTVVIDENGMACGIDMIIEENTKILKDIGWIAPSIVEEENRTQEVCIDIGPFNLYDENIEIEIEHIGISNTASIGLIDDCRACFASIDIDENNKKAKVSIGKEQKIFSAKKIDPQKPQKTMIVCERGFISLYTKEAAQISYDGCLEHIRIDNLIIVSGVTLKIRGGNFKVKSINVKCKKRDQNIK